MMLRLIALGLAVSGAVSAVRLARQARGRLAIEAAKRRQRAADGAAVVERAEAIAREAAANGLL
jgi:Trm5-related predicted tRNA methylase